MIRLPNLPADKANHLAYGALTACAVTLVAGPAVAALVCALSAVGKEIYDRASGTGTPEWLDALATMVGGALVLVPVIVGA